VGLYTAGRFWIEALRIDTVTEIGGFRLNNYTSLIAFLVATAVFVWLIRNRPGRESVVEDPAASPDAEEGEDQETDRAGTNSATAEDAAGTAGRDRASGD
jgi:hypothetical protein